VLLMLWSIFVQFYPYFIRYNDGMMVNNTAGGAISFSIVPPK